MPVKYALGTQSRNILLKYITLSVRSMKCHKTMSGGTYGKHAKVGYNTNPQILSEMTMDHKKKCK